MKTTSRALLISGLCIALFLLLALSLPACADDEPEWKTVVTDGVGAGADKAKARDDAIQDAQRKAVGQGVGLYINSETLVTNAELVSDTIYTHTKGYVHSYKILSENYNAEKDMYWVKIQAQISLKKIEDDLDDLWERIKLGSNPRILLSITAKDADDEAPVTDAIIDSLVKVGFKVYDDSSLNNARQKEALKLVRDGHADAQEIMALQDRSDIILIGKYTARAAEEIAGDPKTFSAKSSLTLRAINTDTGQVVAAATGEGAGAGFSADDAVVATRKRSVEDWYKKNLGLLVRLAVDPSKEYDVNITGCSHAQVMKIDTMLADSRFVRKTDLLSYDKGYAKLAVHFTGSIKMLSKHLATVAGIPLQVESITANTIRVHVTGQ